MVLVIGGARRAGNNVMDVVGREPKRCLVGRDAVDLAGVGGLVLAGRRIDRLLVEPVRGGQWLQMWLRMWLQMW